MFQDDHIGEEVGMATNTIGMVPSRLETGISTVTDTPGLLMGPEAGDINGEMIPTWWL